MSNLGFLYCILFVAFLLLFVIMVVKSIRDEKSHKRHYAASYKALDMYLYELKMYLQCQKLADDYRAKGNMVGYELYMDSARKHYYQSLTYLIH